MLFRCELLSVLYICGVIHSSFHVRITRWPVVNCFQFFIFAVLFTVCEYFFESKEWLWIAFSSLYLRCYSQYSVYKGLRGIRCELLSVLYICGVIHSRNWFLDRLNRVVNCFQFFIFAVLFTVPFLWAFYAWWLWIAFSSLYLRCYSQWRNWHDGNLKRCELLSVLYICGVIHSNFGW